MRRSRERIKEGEIEAKQTLYFVLKNLSIIIAPFAPFASEDIWQKLKTETDKESVHLVSWPEFDFENEDLVKEMEEVRENISLGLQMRQKNNLPVRQPLSKLKVKSLKLSSDYIELIKDELNVKEVLEDVNLVSEIELDIEITEELKLEGNYREFLRAVQDLRKKENLIPSDMINLFIETNEEGRNLINKFESDFKKVAGIKEIEFSQNDGTEIKVGELVFKVKIQK